MGVALAPVIEAVLSAGSGTTCTPSTIEGVECAPETSSVEEGTGVGEPEGTTADDEVLGLGGEMLDAEAEPRLVPETPAVEEAVVVTVVETVVIKA